MGSCMASETTNSFSTPNWAKSAIWYQVMVERFHDGSPDNNPSPMRPWTSEWYTPSPWEGLDGQSFYEYYVFARHYGGDITGLLKRLSYLQELGVNALYLNPVFQSESHHKYNTTDFRHIDENLGAGSGDYSETTANEELLKPATWNWSKSDRIFLDFIKEAKKQGFRIIIDGVFNHVGTSHPAFIDVTTHGPHSTYADWFDITSWKPFAYNGWAGFSELPAFRKSPERGIASETARQHIFDITRRWMDPDGDGDVSKGIDGWRLDVPNEIPMPFWKEWCAYVRSINPDAYITGEIWDQADEWLDGNTFDAVMNYRFADPVIAWIGHDKERITPSELDRRLEELRNAYPLEVTQVLQNLLDSHDTDRLVSKLNNPDRPYDSNNREQEDETYDATKPSSNAYQKARLATFLQMTYIGSPMVYYGDEAGMWGSDDPNNRKPMLWKDLEPYEDSKNNHVLEEHLEFYQQAIALRKNYDVFNTGDFTTIFLDDHRNLWGFIRKNEVEEVLVVLNAGNDPAEVELKDIGGGWECIFGNGNDVPPSVQIEGIEGRAWVRRR